MTAFILGEVKKAFAGVGCIPSLMFEIEVTNAEQPTLWLTPPVCEVDVNPDKEQNSFVGFATIASAIEGFVLDGGQQRLWRVILPLSPQLLQLLDSARRGGDLYLGFLVSTSGFELDSAGLPVRPVSARIVDRYDTSRDMVPHRIPQSDWEALRHILGHTGNSVPERAAKMLTVMGRVTGIQQVLRWIWASVAAARAVFVW